MLKAYQGYFYNGRFVSIDNTPIPERKRVIITVLDDEFSDVKAESRTLEDISKEQQQAFVKYFQAIDTIKDEDLTDADFMELENNRLNFRRELNL